MPNKISFIVASVDRDQQLQRCLTSIEEAYAYAQTTPIEILVVIQQAKQKKCITSRYPEIVNIYYIEEMGLSTARNFAIKKSTGEYLVFLDDDAEIKTDFIRSLTDQISRYRDIVAFCGKLIDPKQNIPFSRLFCDNKIKKLGRLDYQYFMGSGHVLKKEVFEKIGYYDKRFGVGSRYYQGGEETDIFFRLKTAHKTILYLPDLVFYHPIPKVSRNYSYNYGRAFTAMLTNSCINDKKFFFVYFSIVAVKTLKATIRIIQRIFLKGRYIEMDEKYHYGDSLKGMLAGIRDYINNEFLTRNKYAPN